MASNIDRVSEMSGRELADALRSYTESEGELVVLSGVDSAIFRTAAMRLEAVSRIPESVDRYFKALIAAANEPPPPAPTDRM